MAGLHDQQPPSPAAVAARVSVAQADLPMVASSVLGAESWLRAHVLAHYPSNHITAIAVAVACARGGSRHGQDLRASRAAKNLHHALVRWGLVDEIKIDASSAPCAEEVGGGSEAEAVRHAPPAAAAAADVGGESAAARRAVVLRAERATGGCPVGSARRCAAEHARRRRACACYKPTHVNAGYSAWGGGWRHGAVLGSTDGGDVAAAVFRWGRERWWAMVRGQAHCPSGQVAGGNGLRLQPGWGGLPGDFGRGKLLLPGQHRGACVVCVQ